MFVNLVVNWIAVGFYLNLFTQGFAYLNFFSRSCLGDQGVGFAGLY